jgi:hypothetical protein
MLKLKTMKRKFTGIVEESYKVKDREERAFQNKMLRSYLRGDYRFPMGKDFQGNTNWHLTPGYIQMDPKAQQGYIKRVTDDMKKSVT